MLGSCATPACDAFTAGGRVETAEDNIVTRPLEAGDYLFNFTSHSTAGPISPDEFVGKPLVIFFYLADGAPNCTRDVCGFRDLYGEFQRLGVAVLGVGVGSEQSHRSFAQANDVPFPLLADPAMTVCAAAGVLREEAAAGGTPRRSISRTTYLVGPDFRIARTYTDVSAPDHAAAVLADARALVLREEPRHMVQHAPVLLLRNVFPRDLCQTLTQLWETQNEESGFMKEVDGKTVGMTD
jgi:thioredoxin-dependent peroxiredoxin